MLASTVKSNSGSLKVNATDVAVVNELQVLVLGEDVQYKDAV